MHRRIASEEWIFSTVNLPFGPECTLNATELAQRPIEQIEMVCAKKQQVDARRPRIKNGFLHPY
jgi:hypothetical protein